MLQVTPVLQSSSLRHVTVQRNVPEPVEVSTHLESIPGAKPQSGSLAVPPEEQSLELNWFNAVQVLARSEQISAVWPSMLVAWVTATYGRPLVEKQALGAPLWPLPCFQKQKYPTVELLNLSSTHISPAAHCASETQLWHRPEECSSWDVQVLVRELQT